MTPGKTSDGLRVKLRQVGARLRDDQIAAAWTHAEKSRVTFSCASVALGIMLLAKKESLGHGKWIPWCEKFGGKLGGAMAGQIGNGCQFWREVNPRSLRGYTFVAEHFLADLEQGTFTGEIQDHQPKLEGVTPDQVLALDTLGAKDRKAVFGRIEQFVAGRSLRTMLSDFRRAENAAEAEESAHAAAEAAKKASKEGADKDGADAGNGGTAPAGAGSQMEFGDMAVPLGTIDTLFNTKSFVARTDKAFWRSVAAKLKTQMEHALKLAEEVAE